MPRRRNAEGLTPKMLLALPIMAKARTPADGLRELVAQGIITEKPYYQKWQNDPAWIRAVQRERDRYVQAVCNRTQSTAIRAAEAAMIQLIRIALGQAQAAPGQIVALQEVLNRAGVDRAQVTEKASPFVFLRKAIEEAQGKPRIPQLAHGIPVDADDEDGAIEYEDIS